MLELVLAQTIYDIERNVLENRANTVFFEFDYSGRRAIPALFLKSAYPKTLSTGVLGKICNEWCKFETLPTLGPNVKPFNMRFLSNGLQCAFLMSNT